METSKNSKISFSLGEKVGRRGLESSIYTPNPLPQEEGIFRDSLASKSSFWLLCAWLCSFSVAGEEYPQAIRVLHDPFHKPAIPQQNVAEPEISKPSAQQEWIPKLTATLRAGRNSMANVNGKIIKLGETLNGYRLVEVDERSAVFVKNKQRKKLMIDDEKNKQNETNY